jgi:hypothetical protein
MAPNRRKQLMLAALLVVLAIAGYTAWPRTTVAPPQASNRTAPRSGRGAAAQTKDGAPDVRLEALEAERPAPADGGRNLFEFKKEAPPPPPPTVPVPMPRIDQPPPRPGPPPPPPVAPIALKFIGIIEQPDQSKIAVLSDARGVYHGREGETIEGRYRILKIGTESVEIAQINGQGRQTIRLSGS